MGKVSLKSVEKYYGKVHAVKGVDIEVQDEEFMCLLGPSGCGKSTTLRMIAGLEEISKGEIYIGDVLVNRLAPRDRNIAMVFENYALYPTKNVYQNMAFPLRIRKMPNEEIESRIMRTAEILELESLLDRNITQLSGGQKQRVAIGRAIVREPELFLMDEPISHLDAKLKTHMRGELKHLQRVLKTTMIYVTHDQLEAISMADRIAIMDEGEIKQIGTPGDIYNKPENVFVADFVGDPPMNLFDCEIKSDGDKMALSMPWMTIPFPRQRGKAALVNGASDIIFGIRPQDIKIYNIEPDDSDVMGKVWITKPEGSYSVIEVKIGSINMCVVAGSEFQVEMEDTVWLKFRSDKIHLFDNISKEAYI